MNDADINFDSDLTGTVALITGAILCEAPGQAGVTSFGRRLNTDGDGQGDTNGRDPDRLRLALQGRR
jgi:hypothetical protein